MTWLFFDAYGIDWQQQKQVSEEEENLDYAVCYFVATRKASMVMMTILENQEDSSRTRLISTFK